jgi:hypothetical protein
MARVYDQPTADVEYSVTSVELPRVPTDRVRWASVIAGLFTTLAALITLTVLGVALGLSSAENISEPSDLALGAGIFGIIAALLSFALGGFIAAKTAAVGGTGNAILNGAMVWILTIPLLVFILGTGISNLIGTAVVAAGSAADAVVDVLPEGALPNIGTGAEGEAVAQPTPAVPTPSPAQVEQQVEEVAQTAGNVAWTTLLGLGLTAAAAIGGGVLGTRSLERRVVTRETR